MELEIHFAAEAGTFSEGLPDALAELGFRSDGLLGQRVHYAPGTATHNVSCPLTGLHVTWDSNNTESYRKKRAELETLLDKQPDLVGYAHAEVIQPEWDIDLDLAPFSEVIELPISPFAAFQNSEPKKWDIHISAWRDMLDSRLQKLLVNELLMYFIDLQKADGRVKRVFTIQGTSHVNNGLELFELLRDYLHAAGGMAGSIKYERACFWKEYGAPEIIPPSISEFERTYCTDH